MKSGSYWRKAGRRVGGVFFWMLISSPLFGLTLTDATGEKIDFSEAPARIVSLNPDFTENLFALGAGKSLVGVSGSCDYPPPARRVEKVGGLWSPSLEKIVSLDPDLVLATREGNSRRTVESLRRMGLRVWVAGETRSLADYFRLLDQLGKITGRREEAAALRGRFQREILAGRESRPRPRVFFQLGSRPIVSVNRDTLISRLIEAAGGKDLTDSVPARYPVMSREKIIAEDPDFIVVAVMGEEAERTRAGWKRYGDLRAVRQGHVYAVNPDLFCRLTPRLLEGFKELKAILNRELPGFPASEFQ